MDQHERPLSLPDVAVALLSVSRPVAFEVQEIILDLESGAEEKSEAEEPVDVRPTPRADQRADSARKDRRVPARLLEHHEQVIAVLEVEHVVAPPAELDRLALDALASHSLAFLEDAKCEPRPQRRAVVHECAEAEEHEGVADVDRDRD